MEQKQTPYFLFKENLVIENVKAYKEFLPENTEICYAMKSNSESEVLETLNELGCSFEVASTHELDLLKTIHVSPERILYGTSVKPARMIGEFFEYGVQRYAFDSEQELNKIAKNAPGSKVYARILAEDKADSVFTMSEKFGIEPNGAVGLLARAKELGLQPYGVSFNVGSQARNYDAWANALLDVCTVLENLSELNIQLTAVNLGGGFPFSYQDNDGIPDIKTIGGSIREAVARLPYPVQILAEPGRGLVANAYDLIVEVFEKNKRPNGHWLYVDAGTYNALLEAMAYQGAIKYRVSPLKESAAPHESYILTGPTGDSLDVISNDVMLPNDISVGDKLVIHDTGAYSFPLITSFNGFPAPITYNAES
jgi:ornithine decarboxylase